MTGSHDNVQGQSLYQKAKKNEKRSRSEVRAKGQREKDEKGQGQREQGQRVI